MAIAIPPFGLDKKDLPCFKWVEFVLQFLNTASRGEDAEPHTGMMAGGAPARGNFG